MNDTLIVIPTYNEMENVRDISQATLRHAPQVDILFVDDNSPDGTGQRLDELSRSEPRINVFHRKEKQGLGRAYIAGFKWALEREYEYIFEMDADFSHDPAAIPTIRKAMEWGCCSKDRDHLPASLREALLADRSRLQTNKKSNGCTVAEVADLGLSVNNDLSNSPESADLALGTRYLGGIRVINWPLRRLMLSQAAAYYVKIITGMPFTDPTGGYKCYRRSVLKTINLDKITSNGYSFQIEMTHKTWMLGFRIVEVPIVFEERRSGASKMNSSIVREAWIMVWKLLFRSAFRRHPPKK